MEEALTGFNKHLISHNHVIGELGSANQRLDQAIIDQIHVLVSDGARRTDEVIRAVNSFVQQQFPTASRLNPRYYPSRKIIRNHI
ncbi:hypothetical protein DPMN_179038 [Dreissena polymorpha]|uniref:Uncharacterized protein n=1 Tax=Dreissena polymorpha TaxID=45954 RepID=A0A9D4IKE8_DREPO|nr:hypothetical protein DPMN_179038 [Dreissena polymorpha]